MFDISIILLVWRDLDFLEPCLQAIIQASRSLNPEIILIQNGVTLDHTVPSSHGVTTEPLRVALEVSSRASLALRIISNPTNLGVARARNQGLQAAQGRYLLLLDIDTVVDRDAIVNLVRFMDEHKDVGLAGPRLQDAQGNLQLTCRKLPTVASKLLRRIPRQWAEAALGDELLVGYDHQTPRTVDYVIGACQILRRRAYEEVGALDERIFYGPEDVDYCIRMWRKGWRVMYVPDAVVTHTEQRLTKRQTLSKLSFIHAMGLARYFWKHHYALTRPQIMF